MKPIVVRNRARKKPSVGRFLAAACIAQLTLAQARGVGAQELGEVEAAKRICESGPEARVARAQRLAGAARVESAGVLPNPSLVAEHQRAFTGATDHETILGVSVPLTISGRRAVLQDAASARREEAESDADVTLFESALEFRKAYVEAVLDRLRVDALSRQHAALEVLISTVAGLARGGEAAEYDLQRQRLQTQLHLRVLESAKARAAASHALVEAWLGVPLQLARVAPLELAGGAASDAGVTDALLAQHPSLRGLDARARASALEARAADRLWVPELELFAGYRTTTVSSDTGHGIALSLSVPLTFFDHGQGQAVEARAEHESALAEADSLRRRQLARAQAIGAQIEILKVSMAQSEATARDADVLQAKASALYAAGEASLTELMDAFRTAEQARLDAIDTAAEIASARLARMHAAGTQLDAALNDSCSSKPRRAR